MKEILCEIFIECGFDCKKCCTYCNDKDCRYRCGSADRGKLGCQQQRKNQ